MSDLTYNSELPSYFYSPNNNDGNNEKKEDIVNFKKFRTIATIINDVISFQNKAKNYVNGFLSKSCILFSQDPP